jgi:histidinol-phosphate aminotransferase
MYKVSARIQGADVIEVPLLRDRGYALDTDQVLAAWHDDVKLVFLCSPNNPTGNLLERRAIELLCTKLQDKAVVVVDEAYIEFSRTDSIVPALARFENLVVLRTLSKAYALAGTRCGALLAHADIVSLLARVITPYALSTQTIEAVMKFTNETHRAEARKRIDVVLREREHLMGELARSPLIQRVWRSDSNFVLVDCVDADAVLQAAIAAGLIIRDPRSNPALASCLRISVGTADQNARLLRAIAATATAAAGDAA